MIVAIVIAVFVLDLVTKYYVQYNTALRDVVVIPDFFHITYVKNTGMAWSLLSGQQLFLSMVAAVAIGVMVYYLYEKKPAKPVAIALAMMIGGAAGNLFDRLALGYVRDFLDFYIFGYNFPVFNIADSALCIGVFVLFICSLREEKNDNAEVDR